MDSSMEKGRNTLEIRPEEWERYKTLIRELYIDQDMSLRQVQDFMIQAHGFYANELQYRHRFQRAWKLTKNISSRNMAAIIHIADERQTIYNKETSFAWHGNPINRNKIVQSRRRLKLGPGEGASTWYSTENPPLHTPSPLTYWTPIEQSPRESASGTPPLEAARPPLEVVSLDSNTRSPMDMESDNGFVHPKAILLPRLAEPGSLLPSHLVDSHYQQHQFDLDSAYPPAPKDLPDTRSIGLGIVLDEHCSQEDQAVLEPPPFNTYMNCRLQPDPVLTNPPDPELPRPDDNPILSSPSSAEFHPFCTSPDNPFHQQAEILSNPLALWLNRDPDSPELEKVTGIALLEPAGGPCMTREIVSPILSSQFLGSATIGDSWLNSVLRVHDESTRNPTPEF